MANNEALAELLRNQNRLIELLVNQQSSAVSIPGNLPKTSIHDHYNEKEEKFECYLLRLKNFFEIKKLTDHILKKMPEETETSILEETRSLQLHSIEKISALPVINLTINLTQELYGKVKVVRIEHKYKKIMNFLHPSTIITESTTASKIILELAENTVQKTAKMAEPVIVILEKPIKIADSMVCNTMDFMGAQIEKVAGAPQKVTNVLSASVQPAVDYMKIVGNYGVQTVGSIYNIRVFSSSTGSKDREMKIDDTEKELECKKHDCGTQTMMTGNVRNKVKLFSE